MNIFVQIGLYLGENRTEEQTILTYNMDTNEQESNSLQNDSLDVPKCIHVPLISDRNKRDIESSNVTKNITNIKLNKDFVDVPTEPEAPSCLNIPFYAMYNSSLPSRNTRSITWLRYKRDKTSHNLNKDFVDIDVDMEAPNCINIPFYTPFLSSMKNTSNVDTQRQGTGTVRHSGKELHPTHPGG